ncbi:hypothetical protein ACWGJ9_11770 [Curtobacterium citreum]
MRNRAQEYDHLADHLRDENTFVLIGDAIPDLADAFEDASFVVAMGEYYTRPVADGGPADLTAEERLARIRAVLFGDEQYVSEEEIDPDFEPEHGPDGSTDRA